MARMSIGEFARASGLTPKALRIYDDMDLLRPAAVDEVTGYRYYELAQLDTAQLVARLRMLDMSLARIRSVTDLPPGQRHAELVSYWRQAEADHASRRAEFGLLVDQLRDEENDMLIETDVRPGVASRVGRGSRDLQLDALTTGKRLFAIADGFGDDAAVALDVLDALAGLDHLHGAVDAVALLEEGIDRAATTVAGRPGSGCALTAVVFGQSQVAVAHVGDSRLFLVRDGELQRLTRDHTYVSSLVDAGRLTPEEARIRDDRALLNRAIASDTPPAPDISVHNTRTGDRFVLTTDGVHGVLSASDLADLLLADEPTDDIAAEVENAVVAAGAPDNYAVVVIDIA